MYLCLILVAHPTHQTFERGRKLRVIHVNGGKHQKNGVEVEGKEHEEKEHKENGVEENGVKENGQKGNEKKGEERRR